MDKVEHGLEVAKVVISREMRDGDTFCDEVTIRAQSTPIDASPVSPTATCDPFMI